MVAAYLHVTRSYLQDSCMTDKQSCCKIGMDSSPLAGGLLAFIIQFDMMPKKDKFGTCLPPYCFRSLLTNVTRRDSRSTGGDIPFSEPEDDMLGSLEPHLHGHLHGLMAVVHGAGTGTAFHAAHHHFVGVSHARHHLVVCVIHC